MSRAWSLNKEGLQFFFIKMGHERFVHQLEFGDFSAERLHDEFELVDALGELLALGAVLVVRAVVVRGVVFAGGPGLREVVEALVVAEDEVFVEVLDEAVFARDFAEAVVVELPDERAEVAVAEVQAQDFAGKEFDIGDEERISGLVPDDDFSQVLILLSRTYHADVVQVLDELRKLSWLFGFAHYKLGILY